MYMETPSMSCNKSLAVKAFNVTFQLYFLETTFSTFLLIFWLGVGRGSSVFSTAACCILLESLMTTALLPCLVLGCFCLMSSRENVATLENEIAELVNQDTSYSRATPNLQKELCQTICQGQF